MTADPDRASSIMFAPLRSTYLIHRTRVDSKGRKPTERRSQYSRDNGLKYSLVCEASELEPTSPKSIYALADSPSPFTPSVV